MTNTIATFENTVGILVKAFLEGTLAQGSCRACAVGNICAAAIGVRVINNGTSLQWESSRPAWDNVFFTGFAQQRQYPDAYHGEAKRQIEATGYAWQQLARVESAFETVTKDCFRQSLDQEQAEFAGLMAVVDVLADIHGIDLTAATAAKALFVRA